MKNRFTLFILFFLLIAACTESTEPLDPAKSYDHGVLIVNEGNFFSGDGEVTHFDPMTGDLTNNLFQTTNGVVLAAYIEQLRVIGEQVYIVDSQQGAPKIVVVDPASFREKGRVTGLEIPRDVAVWEDRLFIADWGNYDDQGNYTNPASFVAVTDLTGGAIKDKIPVPSRPETMVEFAGHIFVACQAGREILRIDPAALEITGRIPYDASPSAFLVRDGKLMLHATLDQKLRVDEIDPETLLLSKKAFDIPHVTALVLDEAGDAFALTTEYSDDYLSTENSVLHFSLSGTGTVNPLYEAGNLKALGLDRKNRQLYISDDNAIQGNGTVIITDLEGEEIQKLEVGRVPSGFHFY